MADGKLMMTPSTMRERASEYRNQAEVVNGVIAKMDSLLQSLKEEWLGSASEAYANRYSELRPSFVKTEELIREIDAFLCGAADEFEEVDRRLNQRC